ncbi:DnaD domain-containing protein [Priestia megaterium]|uniref:DnaD domain-containing protein n=1 Tax=Priestia megaterium TaxID=1404 RepID=UPI0025AF1F93|nr:DnaD domain protein [Priestia megaterium]MDN3229510.1 DnaD domain protein [Priestia megaterium]
MAKYRQVHTTFWQDPKVLEEMTPEDKYFYLYLLTNPNTTQIGIYQITKKQMAFDLGYSTESVNSLLHRFITLHKLIKYNEQTRELAILNWGKYNLHKAGKPVIDCVNKELKEVKDKTLLLDIMKHIPNDSVLQAFSRHVDDTYNDTSPCRGQEKEEEKEEEKEKENKKKKGSPTAFEFYEENFGLLSSHLIQEINAWLNDFNGNHEVVIEALKISVERNKRNWGYTKAILKDWYSKGVKSLSDIKALEIEFKKKSLSTKTRVVRREMVPEWLNNNNKTEEEVTPEYDPSFEEEKRKLEAELKALGEELREKGYK